MVRRTRTKAAANQAAEGAFVTGLRLEVVEAAMVGGIPDIDRH